MFKFIGIITNMLRNPNFFNQIIGLMKNFGDKDIISLLMSGSNPAKLQQAMIRALNPNRLISMLSRLPKKQWQNILEQIKAFDKETYNNILKEFELKETGWTILSSSWLQKGYFQTNPKNQQIGTLTILISSKKGIWYGPYTYPQVPSEIYYKMRKATSKFGSRNNPIGAGSIFWKYFLDDFLPSEIRKYVKNKLAKQGIYNGKISNRVTRIQNKELQSTLHGIQKFSKNYYRTKKSKLILSGIDSINYASTRREYVNNFKNELKKVTTSNIIKVYEKSNSVKKWSKPIKQTQKVLKKGFK